MQARMNAQQQQFANNNNDEDTQSVENPCPVCYEELLRTNSYVCLSCGTHICCTCVDAMCATGRTVRCAVCNDHNSQLHKIGTKLQTHRPQPPLPYNLCVTCGTNVPPPHEFCSTTCIERFREVRELYEDTEQQPQQQPQPQRTRQRANRDEYNAWRREKIPCGRCGKPTSRGATWSRTNERNGMKIKVCRLCK